MGGDALGMSSLVGLVIGEIRPDVKPLVGAESVIFVDIDVLGLRKFRDFQNIK